MDHKLNMSSVFKVMKPDCVLGCSGKSVAKRSIIPLNSALVRLHLTVGKLCFWCTPVPERGQQVGASPAEDQWDVQETGARGISGEVKSAVFV